MQLQITIVDDYVMVAAYRRSDGTMTRAKIISILKRLWNAKCGDEQTDDWSKKITRASVAVKDVMSRDSWR